MIFLIKEHEPLSSMVDPDNKPWRTQKMFLDLTAAGFDCRLFMSSFDHWKKMHTASDELSPQFKNAELLSAPAYPRNGSILRFVSGIVFAFRFFIAGQTGPHATHIVVSCPGFLILIASLLLKACYRCKVYVDMRDNWPSTLCGFFPKITRPLACFIFTKWLQFLLLFADEILVPSENLADLSKSISGRRAKKIPFLLDPDRVAGVSDEPHDRDMLFAGSLSTFFDYEILGQAADFCAANDSTFHILGDGEFFDLVRERFSGQSHVRIHGHVTYGDIAAISKRCQTALYPYRKDAGFDNHETNKLTDYLTMGLFVLSTVPLPIDQRYFRMIPPVSYEDMLRLPTKQEIRAYGLSKYVGSYADHLIAAGLIRASS